MCGYNPSLDTPRSFLYPFSWMTLTWCLTWFVAILLIFRGFCRVSPWHHGPKNQGCLISSTTRWCPPSFKLVYKPHCRYSSHKPIREIGEPSSPTFHAILLGASPKKTRRYATRLATRLATLGRRCCTASVARCGRWPGPECCWWWSSSCPLEWSGKSWLNPSNLMGLVPIDKQTFGKQMGKYMKIWEYIYIYDPFLKWEIPNVDGFC